MGLHEIIAVIVQSLLFLYRDRNVRLGQQFEKDETYVQMNPTFHLSSGAFSDLSASGPPQFFQSSGFYTNSGAIAAEPPTPPPKKSAGASVSSGQDQQNPYVSLPSRVGAVNPMSVNSDTDEYIKMQLEPTSFGADGDSLYEHIPADSKSQ